MLLYRKTQKLKKKHSLSDGDGETKSASFDKRLFWRKNTDNGDTAISSTAIATVLGWAETIKDVRYKFCHRPNQPCVGY